MHSCIYLFNMKLQPAAVSLNTGKRETASLSVFKGKKMCLPAALKLTN